jgi:rRNA-processing protein FCF1
MKIILDTNFLIDCVRFNINFKTELAGNELFVVEPSLIELNKIVKRGTKESRLAKIALEIVYKDVSIRVIKTEDYVDESLLSYSKKGYAIATHDRILKKKLKELRAKIIYTRQKKYLVVE